MLEYHPNLKYIARSLRTEMTESEQLLWSRLRRKQLQRIQFYRQKPIGAYIVDFYAPKAKLVVEVDGPQHLRLEHRQNDAERDAHLKSHGLKVLRFSNTQVLRGLEAVVAVISESIVAQGVKPPPTPLYDRGALTADG